MNQAERDLIHRVLDGEATPTDDARLQELLARDAEARRLHDELQAFDRMLAAVEPAEPPPGLRQAVLGALPADRHAAGPGWSPAAFVREVLAALWARPALAFAYTFSVGLAVGLAAYAVVAAGPAGDDAALVGTMAGDAARLQTVHEVPLQPYGLDGRLQVRAGGGNLYAALDLESARPVEVRLGFGSGVSLRSFSRTRDHAGVAVTTGPREVRLQATGDDRYLFLFRTSTERPVLRVEVRSGGAVLYEGDLTINTAGD